MPAAKSSTSARSRRTTWIATAGTISAGTACWPGGCSKRASRSSRSHSNYDTHDENFDFHIEQVGEFDRPFAALIDDLDERGLLEHSWWWSCPSSAARRRSTTTTAATTGRGLVVCLGGCGIKEGVVVGKTNANGTAVTDREVHGGHLFHTYLRAVGLDPNDSVTVDRRATQLAGQSA